MESFPSGSKSAPGLLVPKPTRMPYINFVQAYRNSYTGPYKKATEMVKMAAAVWRKLSDSDKAPFVAIAEQEKARGPTRRSKRVKRLQARKRRLASRARSSDSDSSRSYSSS